MDTRLTEIYNRLVGEYDSDTSLLHYNSPFQLLIAVSLSAQTTDNQVNLVTPQLFSLYPDSTTMAQAQQKDIETIIHSTGFYRNKAKNCIAAARTLVQNFAGQVPSTMEELITIPGIGRKSAGVILHHIFQQPAIIVDTHFARVTKRLGMTNSKNPEIIEKDIARLVEPQFWSEWSMSANLHGRRICTARKPGCTRCILTDLCPKFGVTDGQ